MVKIKLTPRQIKNMETALRQPYRSRRNRSPLVRSNACRGFPCRPASPVTTPERTGSYRAQGGTYSQ